MIYSYNQRSSLSFFWAGLKSLQADFTNGASDRKVGFEEGRKACYGEMLAAAGNSGFSRGFHRKAGRLNVGGPFWPCS